MTTHICAYKSQADIMMNTTVRCGNYKQLMELKYSRQMCDKRDIRTVGAYGNGGSYFGTRMPHSNAQAEFRQLDLSILVQEAKISTMSAAISIKKVYKSAMMDITIDHKELLNVKRQEILEVAQDWLRVSQACLYNHQYLSNTLRNSYAEAHQSEENKQDDWNKKEWTVANEAFSWYRKSIQSEKDSKPRDVIAGSYLKMGKMAFAIANKNKEIAAFLPTICTGSKQPNIHAHMFNCLCSSQEPRYPELSKVDEELDYMLLEFDALYVAIVQLSRGAHLLPIARKGKEFELYSFDTEFNDGSKYATMDV